MPPKRSGYVGGPPVAPGSPGTAEALPEVLDVRVMNYAGPQTGTTYVLIATGMPGQLPPDYKKASWQCKTRRRPGGEGGLTWNDAFHGVKVKGTAVRFQVMEGEGKNISRDKVIGFCDVPLSEVCRDIGRVLDTIPGVPLTGGPGSLRVRMLAKGGALEAMPSSPAHTKSWSAGVPGARTMADLQQAIAASEKTFADEEAARKALLSTLDDAEKAEIDAAEKQSREQWEAELKKAEEERARQEGDYDRELETVIKGTELEHRRKQRVELDVFRQTRMTMTMAKLNATKADFCDHITREREIEEAAQKAEAARKAEREAAEKKRREEEEAARKAAEEAEKERIRKLEQLKEDKAKALEEVRKQLVEARDELERVEDDRLEAQEAVAVLGTQTRVVHNELEDLKGKIRVFCRTRPEKKGEVGGVLEFPGGDARSVILREGEGLRAKVYDFLFDRAFAGDTAQEEVFHETKGMIQSCIDGCNTCIFAYGQTGSGKTHTLVGTQNDPGIARRSMRTFFDYAAKMPAGQKLQIECSMVELYIDTFFDLLGGGKARKPLKLKRAGTGSAEIEGRNWCKAESYEGLVGLFGQGEGARSVRCTSMNERSSRSHLIFVIRATTMQDGKPIRGAQYALVDLAGSERLKKSGVEKEGLREAVAINKSLSALGNVIEGLSKGSRHIPYRDHELTQAMESFMTGEAKMLMFVAVSPAKASFGESKGSLLFAQRTKQVQLASSDLLAKNKAAIQAKEGELAGLMGKLHAEAKRAGEKEIEREDLNEQIESFEEIIVDIEQELDDIAGQLVRKK